MEATKIKEQDNQLTKEMGERLNLALGASSMTNKAFKEETSTSDGSLDSYLKGKAKVSMVRLIRYAEVLKINLLWLTTGEGSMRGKETSEESAPALDHELIMDIIQEKGTFFADERKPLEHRAKMFVKYYDLKLEEKSGVEDSSKKTG